MHHQGILLLIHNNKTFVVKTDLRTQHLFLVPCCLRIGSFACKFSAVRRGLLYDKVEYSAQFTFLAPFVLAKITGWQKRPYRAILYIY